VILRPLILALFFNSLAMAQTPEAKDSTPAEPAKPSIVKIDETRYQIGGVILDQKTREIRFSCKVNMTEGLLEYIIVHINGKVHESLLVTEISPTHLNMAFALLRYSPSPELYPLPNATGGTSGDFPEVSAEIRAAARVTLEVEWADEGKIRRMPINDWIQHSVKLTSMPAGPWVYGGSEFHEGQYVPEITGDIAAIFIAPSALIHYPGDDRGDDTIWTPYSQRIPAFETKVTVIIAPYQDTKPILKP
jgi:hypothetical protein